MAAFHLYSQTLGYEIDEIEAGYYADGEDAYAMRCNFVKSKDVLSTPALPTTPMLMDAAEGNNDMTAVIEGIEGVSVDCKSSSSSSSSKASGGGGAAVTNVKKK